MTHKHDATLLLVDDDSFILATLVDILKPWYRLLVAKNGKEAIAHTREEPRPDLILLDIVMPDMDGFTVCETLKSTPATRDIPIIFVTGSSSSTDEAYGFGLGASDYITKPLSAPIIIERIKNHLALKRAQHRLADQNELLEELVRDRTRELEITKDVTIHGMALLSGLRDNETGNHIRRTQHYIREIANYLKDNTAYDQRLDDATINLLFKSAPLHDLGKVGIPDAILRKPGALEPHEFEIMKTHTTLGFDALRNSEQDLGHGSSSFLCIAREIAYTHHEKWDGSGYPRGLRGEEIPLSGQLMAVADVYDALISRRIYKPAFSHEKSFDIITQGAGVHFNPDAVQAFTAVEHTIVEISHSFVDSDE